MSKASEAEPATLYLEALPKAVKRALRGSSGLSVVECRASDNANLERDEHGKTTLVYTTTLDATALNQALHDLTRNANIEQDLLLRDDEEDA